MENTREWLSMINGNGRTSTKKSDASDAWCIGGFLGWSQRWTLHALRFCESLNLVTAFHTTEADDDCCFGEFSRGAVSLSWDMKIFQWRFSSEILISNHRHLSPALAPQWAKMWAQLPVVTTKFNSSVHLQSSMTQTHLCAWPFIDQTHQYFTRPLNMSLHVCRLIISTRPTRDA